MSMFKAYKARREIKKWRDLYVPLAPKVGDVAPDFKLYDVSGSNMMRLSDYRDKQPVALVFGSYT
jgi:hypothetical protein